ncbi:MAG TPA: prolyl oligopeptidase family serine peptidase [Opitutaceae bacterium]|nr:prolyl oligopeptidase family serine peptidase [Opitutaceae bacterium]HND62213.1 prolyl oligopeptidase family serine peptidase [Opitutaceae bacterium]
MKRLTSGLLTVLLATGAALLRAEAPPLLPLETLFGDSEMQSVQISPTGRYLTWLAPKNQRMNLAIQDRETKRVQWLTNMKEESVVSYVWAKKDRILFAQQYGGREQYGMFACDPDGKNLVVINKLERVEATSDGAGEGDLPSSERDLPKSLVSLLPHDPDCILMNRIRGNSFLGDVIKVNIRTGRETIEERNYINARIWIPDSKGVIRAAICTDFEEPITIKYRKDEKSEWRTIGQFSIETSLFFEEAAPLEPHWRPSIFAKDDRTLYVKSFMEHDTAAIRTLDPETGAWGPVLFHHPRVEPGDRLANYRRGGLSSRAAVDGLIFNTNGDLAGVSYDDEYPEVQWLDPKMAKMMHDLDSALPGTRNAIVSGTSDGSLYVIRAASDRDPGTFYLFDAKKFELAAIGRARSQINPAQMAEMRPIRFKARDGLEVAGYLTIPAGREAKNLPMILVPHGGPYGPRDTWGFADQVQYLANRGYAVLQINYRGSGGYGLKFQLAGYRGWGRQMQNDLTDGVKWCIEQGLADPNRVGIFGASYGGYAVLAGLTLTPDLYCCGIDYVGVSDLEARAPSRSAVLPRVLREGQAIRELNPVKDAELLHAVNPIAHIQEIRAPLFAAYGKNDPRVRFDQWQLLESKLKQYGKTYESLIEENEGHGFRKLENKLDFYRRIEAFLAKYMNVPEGKVKIGTPVVKPGGLGN